MSPVARHSEGAERRIPWVTCTLAALCVCGLFLAKSAARDAESAVSAAIAEAESFFRDRPYLEPPLLLEARLGAAQAEVLKQRFDAQRRRRAAPPIPRGIQAREQRELDEIVSIATTSLQALPEQRWGLRARDPVASTFVSHLVFHDGWLHLVAGLMLLLLFGFHLESVWGPRLFGAVAAGSTLASGGLFVLGNPELEASLIGTTGLVAGLFGAFLAFFVGTRRDAPTALGTALTLMLVGAPLWFGQEWSVARVHELSPDAIGGASATLWVLAGGFGFGALASLGVRLLGIQESMQRSEAKRRTSHVAIPQLERALEARSAGRLDDAFNLLSTAYRKQPDDRDVALVLWDVANDLGRPAAASRAILGLVRSEIKQGETESAVKHWLELAECGLATDAEAALLIRMAPLLRDAGFTDAAATALRNALARADAGSAASVASRVARFASDLDPKTARDAAWQALGSMDLDMKERQALEAILAELQPQLGMDEPMETPVRERPRAAVSAADLVQPELVDASAPTPAPAPAPAETPKPHSIELDTHVRPLEAVLAVPVTLEPEGLRIMVAGTGSKRVRYDRIDAVSVVAVDGIASKPVIVVDLVLNWMSLKDESLRIIRLRGDQFDPRGVAPGHANPLEALRAMIDTVVSRSGATPLPDLQSVQGMPWAAFADLASYQRDVLMVDAAEIESYSWRDDD